MGQTCAFSLRIPSTIAVPPLDPKLPCRLLLQTARELLQADRFGDTPGKLS